MAKQLAPRLGKRRNLAPLQALRSQHLAHLQDPAKRRRGAHQLRRLLRHLQATHLLPGALRQDLPNLAQMLPAQGLASQALVTPAELNLGLQDLGSRSPPLAGPRKPSRALDLQSLLAQTMAQHYHHGATHHSSKVRALARRQQTLLLQPIRHSSRLTAVQTHSNVNGTSQLPHPKRLEV